ncbi:MAG: LiaF-related protein [Bacteroidales bacterium]|nr:LiaF-related protein [Bacteroidales bacterium]
MKNPDSGRLFIGLLFIIIGGLLFVRFTGIYLPFELPDYLFRWPMILIVRGLFFVFSREDKTTGVILLLIGAVFQSQYIFSLPLGTIIKYAIPVFLVVFGVMLIMPRHYFKKKRLTDKNVFSDETINSVNILSGGTILVESEHFKGGEIICILGGSKIIFTKSVLSPGGGKLDISCILGGCEVYVPDDWTVRTNISTLFAGVEDKRFKMDPSMQTNPDKVLTIKGNLLFSGLDIRKA